MSIQQYNALAKNAVEALGVTLPTMHAKQLIVHTQQADINTARDIVTKMQPSEGWALCTDNLICHQLPTHHGLLEAEFVQVKKAYISV